MDSFEAETLLGAIETELVRWISEKESLKLEEALTSGYAELIERKIETLKKLREELKESLY